MEKYFFAIYSESSRNSTAGLRPQVMWTKESAIFRAADDEITKSGLSYEDMAGIAWIEDENGNLRPARQLTSEEAFDLALEKLSDDGRMFEIFPDDEAGAENFIERAEFFGLEDQAREITEKLHQW